MRPDYPNWLSEQKYSDTTRSHQVSQIRKVEDAYGDLESHYLHGTYDGIINELVYSTADERVNKPNPSKITFDGNIRNNLATYKSSAVLYRRFLSESLASPNVSPLVQPDVVASALTTDETKQRLSLERDMQAALRRDIASLDPALKIIDDGVERSVDSGFIDITCDDGRSLIVVELKAGQADSRAIGQILGYMGDLQEEEGDRPVRGILVAHSFDKRAKAAARVVPTLSLKTYSIAFQFVDEG